MKKQYHVRFISFIGIMIVGLFVGLSPQKQLATNTVTLSVSQVFAEDSDGEYRDGERSSGEHSDGEHSDGEHSDGEHSDGEHSSGEHSDAQTGGSAQTFEAKPVVKQY